METLPNEIIEHILSYLPFNPKINLVSKRFNEIAKNLVLYKVKYLDKKYGIWRNKLFAIFRDEDLDIIKIVVRETMFNNWDRIVKETNHKDVLAWAVNQGATRWAWIIGSAMKNGSPEIYNYVLKYFNYKPTINYYAGKYNNLPLVYEAINGPIENLGQLIIGAAKGANMEIVKAAFERIANSNISDIYTVLNLYLITTKAISRGCRVILQYIQDILKVEIPWNYVAKGAALGGHITLLNLAIRKGADEWDWILLYNASIGGNINIINLVIRERPYDLHQVATWAATKGHLNVILYMKKLGIYINWTDIAVNSAGKGNLELVELAIYNGASDLNQVATRAAKYGHGHIISYLVSIDAEIDWSDIAKSGAMHRWVNIIDIVVKNCPSDKLETIDWDWITSYSIWLNDVATYKYIINSPISSYVNHDIIQNESRLYGIF
jgi:hypothetical protein